MNKQEYLSNVMQEIEAIKKHATETEIARLDFETLKPRYEKRCIYGQMTGGCYTPRALSLIRKCTPIVVEGLGDRSYTFSDIKSEINGKPTKGNIYNARKFYSVLESYIVLKGSKNEKIIQYLKGETKTLKL